VRSSHVTGAIGRLYSIGRQFLLRLLRFSGSERTWQMALCSAVLACMCAALACTAASADSKQSIFWDVTDDDIKAKLVVPAENVGLASVATFEVSVLASPNVRYELEIPKSEWIKQAIEVVGEAPVLVEKGDGESVPDIWQVQVMPLDAGTFDVSGPTIVYGPSGLDESQAEVSASASRLILPSRTLTVSNPLENTDDAQLSAMKDPLAAKVDYSRLVLMFLCIAAAALFVTAIIWIARRLRFGRTQEPTDSAPTRPAHEIAYERLRAIEKSGLIERGCCREFHYAISECLREYLKNRFGIPALEMTTEEYLEYSRVREDLPYICRDKAGEILRLSDLVKFAKRESLIDEMRLVLSSVRRLIDETVEKDDVHEGEVEEQ